MIIRKGIPSDRSQIVELYRAVTGMVKGIGRRPHEITETYIYSLLSKKEDQIVFLVATDEDNKILGFAHGIKNGLESYDHILSDLTIVVQPNIQGQGIGKHLGHSFLKHIFENRSDIKRVEMEAIKATTPLQELNKAGFNIEGEIKDRIRNLDGTFSDSILMAWINPNFKG